MLLQGTVLFKQLPCQCTLVRRGASGEWLPQDCTYRYKERKENCPMKTPAARQLKNNVLKITSDNKKLYRNLTKQARMFL